MSRKDIVHWLTTSPYDRQHGHEIAAINHTVEQAVTQIRGIHEVGRHTAYETMVTNALIDRVEKVAPDPNGSYQAIAAVTFVESAKVIADMNRRYRYGR